VELATDLQREQRIATRDLTEPSELGAGQVEPELVVQQAMETVLAQRPDDDSAVMGARNEWHVDSFPSHGREQTYPRRPHAAQRELECPLRRRVQPVNVVDRHDERALVSEKPENVDERRTDGALVRRLDLRLLEEQRNRECSSSRWAEHGRHVVEHGLEQVGDGRERKPYLDFCRSAREHTAIAGDPGLDRYLPDGRLADARLAFEYERRGPVANSIDEPVHLAELELPADETARHRWIVLLSRCSSNRDSRRATRG
jgi:hypothetical protein